jgi:hypothetical protein
LAALVALISGVTMLYEAKLLWGSPATPRSPSVCEQQPAVDSSAGSFDIGSAEETGSKAIPLPLDDALLADCSPPTAPMVVASFQPRPAKSVRKPYSWEPRGTSWQPKAAAGAGLESAVATESEKIRAALREVILETTSSDSFAQKSKEPAPRFGNAPPSEIAARTAAPRPVQKQQRSSDHTSAVDTIFLEGTMIAGGRHMAIVGDQLIGLGDSVAGHEVTEIGSGWICCDGIDGRIPLRSRKPESEDALTLCMRGDREDLN